MKLPRALRALRVRAYRTQWSASLLLNTGFWMTTVCLQWHIAAVTNADVFLLGAIFFFLLIPMFVLTPVVGVMLDRRNRVRVFRAATTGTSLVATVGAVLLIVYPQLPFAATALIALGFGTCNAFQSPAGQSLVPNWLTRETLSSGIALSAMTGNIARLTGPAIAAPLILFGSAGGGLIGYAILAATATVLAYRLPSTPRPVSERHKGGGGGLVAAIRHAARRPPALAAVGLAAAVSVFASSYTSALPALVTGPLDAGPSALSLMLSAGAVGSLFGAFATAASRPASTLIVPGVLALLLASALAALGSTHHLALAVVLAVIGSGLNTAVMNSLNIAMHTTIDDFYRGRLSAMFMVAWGGMIPIGALLLGTVGARLGIGPALALNCFILGAIAVTVAIITLVRARKRGFPEGDPGSEG